MSMKILRARFENFRLLRDLTLDFSIDADRPLTVIRAENESGKTTILTALQWGLYGDGALPGRSVKDFRLHPIDWDVENGRSVNISVEIDIQVTDDRNSPRHGVIPIHRVYRLIRSTTETVKDGDSWDRSGTHLSMYELTDAGSSPVEYPEVQRRELLPEKLRDLFFTDGDRALRFIEADSSSKRNRVRDAIRSLLGLDLIEYALGHVANTVREVNRKAKASGASTDLSNVISRIGEIDEEIDGLKTAISDAKTQESAFEGQINEIARQISDALIAGAGDKKKLEGDLKQANSMLTNIRKQQEKSGREHSDLFRNMALGRDILAPVLATSIAKLDNLREQGGFPKTAIPVLQDRLQDSMCMCGESLSPETADGQRRISHIEHLIEQTRKSDEIQGILTDLYFGSADLRVNDAVRGHSWIDIYGDVSEERDNLAKQGVDFGSRVRELEAAVGKLGDTNIAALYDTKRLYDNQRQRARDSYIRNEATLGARSREKIGLETQQRTLLERERKGRRFLAELNVVQDIRTVLDSAYNRITNEELQKVSNLTNTYFLQMIGSDPEQKALIREVTISNEFDILVYGPGRKMLDPDRDLNGASRRALTIAFILGLTKVSEVEAPNVIDTPLGMMSGYVKNAVLRTAVRESSQLILFLTRSEISGCESILDAAAGKVITLTNPAHYPRMLEYDPQVDEATIIRCSCTHRDECQICQRRMDMDSTDAA